MRVILIRHGEATGNRQCYIGWQDAPLTPTGIAQAAELAAALESERIDRIYCSPLSRAVDTALPLACARRIELTLRDGLKEINYGDLQGAVKGKTAFRLRKTYLHQPMPGGESLQDVWNRLTPVVREVREDMCNGLQVAIVSHYWSNRMILGMLADLELDSVFARTDYKPANATACAIDVTSQADGDLVVSISSLFSREDRAGAPAH